MELSDYIEEGASEDLIPKTPTITNKSVIAIMPFGYFVKASAVNGELLICGEDLFEAMFKNERYYHVKQLKLKGVDAQFVEGRKAYTFYSIEKVASYFLTYKVQKPTFEEQPQRYANYLEFIRNGGVNWIVELCEGVSKAEFTKGYSIPDISHLEGVGKTVEVPAAIIPEKEPEPIKVEMPTELKPEVQPELPKETPQEAAPPARRLFNFLQGADIYLWATLLLICCLLPFTISAIVRYNGFEGEGIFQEAASLFMCCGIAIAWDFSILVFTLKGKEELANIGSTFQVVFFSVHFNLIEKIVDLLGYNGASFQELTVTVCIVLFSAILVNQFSRLARGGEDFNRKYKRY